MAEDSTLLDLDSLEQALSNISVSTSHSLDKTVRAAHLLADASRHDERIRRNLGQPIALQQLVAIVDCSLNDNLEAVDVALRCIGNACIDNDTARQNITELGLSWASRCLAAGRLGDRDTAELTIKVLYNICLNYESAQKQCFRDHIHFQLVSYSQHPDVLLSSEKSTSPLWPDLLLWICSHKDALDDAEAQEVETIRPVDVALLASYYREILEPEDWSALLEAGLMFLRDPRVQREAVAKGQANEFWNTFVCNEEYISTHENEEDMKMLVPISTSLIWILSDVAALPDFAQHNHVRSPLINSVLGWITAGPRSSNNRLFTAACQVLGNVLWSTKDLDDFSYLVEARYVHEDLLRNGCSPEDAELFHAAAGVVLQLARPSTELRERIASSKWTNPFLELSCRHENPQLQKDGMRLLRALGQTSPAIQSRFAALAREVVANASTSAGAAGVDVTMAEVPD